MKLVLKEGKVFATHDDDQYIEGKYEGCTFEIVPNNTKVDYETGTYDDTDCSFADIKEAKLQSVRNSHALSELKTINLHGYDWQSGKSSAISLDGALRNAERQSATTVNFSDVLNRSRALTISQATEIVNAVYADTETRFFAMQTIKNKIEDCIDGNKVGISAINTSIS